MSEFLDKEGLKFIADNYLILDQDAVFQARDIHIENDWLWGELDDTICTFDESYIVVNEEEFCPGLKVIKCNFDQDFHGTRLDGQLQEYILVIMNRGGEGCQSSHFYNTVAKLHLGNTRTIGAGEFYFYRHGTDTKDWYLLNNHQTLSNPHKITKNHIGLSKVENKSVSDIRDEFTRDYELLPKIGGRFISTPYDLYKTVVSFEEKTVQAYRGSIEDPIPNKTNYVGDEFYLNIAQDLIADLLILEYYEDACRAQPFYYYIPLQKFLSIGVYKCIIEKHRESWNEYICSIQPTQVLTKNENGSIYNFNSLASGECAVNLGVTKETFGYLTKETFGTGASVSSIDLEPGLYTSFVGDEVSLENSLYIDFSDGSRLEARGSKTTYTYMDDSEGMHTIIVGYSESSEVLKRTLSQPITIVNYLWESKVTADYSGTVEDPEHQYYNTYANLLDFVELRSATPVITSGASGDYSFVAGEGTEATGRGQTALGRFNERDSQALLMLGNGSERNPSNAFKVMQDGRTWLGKTETTKATSGSIIEIIDGFLSAHPYSNSNTPYSLIARDANNRAFVNPPQNGEGGRYQIANRIYVDNHVGGSTSINLGAGKQKVITFDCSNHEGSKTDVPRGLYNGTGMYIIYANSAGTISIVTESGGVVEFQGKFLILSVSPHSDTKVGIRINAMYYNSLLDAGWKHAYTVLGKTMTITAPSDSEMFVHYHQVSPFRCDFPV